MTTLRTNDFDFPFDDALIAQVPLGGRDQSRLLMLKRPGGRVSHHRFADLPDLLRQGDLLVLNDTKVIPARFFVRRQTGGRIEGLFLQERSTGLWEAMLKGADRCRAGQRLSLENSSVALELRENLGQGRWVLACEPALPAIEVLEQAGLTPLPPYIRRMAKAAGMDSQASEPADRQRYQTVYAARPGAVAAPTAGLHFTPEVFEALAACGITTARVTLHVGAGTFLPVKADSLPEHTMHSEWYELTESTALQLNAARAAGRRIVAVGTTSVRVLETVAAAQADPRTAVPELSGARDAMIFHACSGWTRIFIYPPYQFRAVDALITNFHLPKSTLLMLVAAFCAPGRTEGIDMIKSAYAQAVAERYRFFSYGDAVLIE